MPPLESARKRSEVSWRREPLRRMAEVLAVAAVYVLAAKLGLMLGAVSRFATLVWAPTGISLAVLLCRGYGLWPGIALGAFAVNAWLGAPLPVALGIGAGNTLEALAGAYALERLAGLHRSFDRLRHVLGLIALGALASTLLSATFGVLSLIAGGLISGRDSFEVWRAWWLGDALGDLVVAPLLLAWTRPRPLRAAPRPAWEAAALALSVVGASALIFGSAPGSEVSGFLQAYMLTPLLIWAALRFELRGATAAMFAVAALAIVGTALGRGPFVQETLSRSLLLLQAFMAVTAVTVLVLGAVIAERTEAMLRREEYLAIVSHDLRNPLNVIGMASKSLLSLLPHEAGDEAAPKAAALLERSLDRVNALIRDFLDSSAIEAGRLKLERQTHDASSLVRDAMEMMRPLAGTKSQRLEHVLPRERVPVFCDRERVLQVFSNLLGNALKFTPAGGSVTLRVDRLGDEALFSVSDTGPGIAPDQIPHVFERFWRSPQPPRDGARGSGLGLSIASSIVEAHGGTLRVRSQVGAGSEFFMMLPVASADASAAGSAAASPAAATGGVRWRRVRGYLLHSGRSGP